MSTAPTCILWKNPHLSFQTQLLQLLLQEASQAASSNEPSSLWTHKIGDVSVHIHLSEMGLPPGLGFGLRPLGVLEVPCTEPGQGSDDSAWSRLWLEVGECMK